MAQPQKKGQPYQAEDGWALDLPHPSKVDDPPASWVGEEESADTTEEDKTTSRER